MTVRLEIYSTLVICSLLGIAICGVCPISTPTVTSVPKCPATQEEMEKAARRKKCEMMADSKNCDVPPVYHCLLNQWKNDTIEVCASPWYISGFCAIYNTVEMKVTDDFTRDCATINVCPTRYHSPEAYKYQICYEKINTGKISTSSPTTSFVLQSRESFSDTIGFMIVIGILCIIIVSILVCLFSRKLRGKLLKIVDRDWSCFGNTRLTESITPDEEENISNSSRAYDGMNTTDCSERPLLDSDENSSPIDIPNNLQRNKEMNKDDSEVLTANFVQNQSNIGSDAIDTRALPNPKKIIDAVNKLNPREIAQKTETTSSTAENSTTDNLSPSTRKSSENASEKLPFHEHGDGNSNNIFINTEKFGIPEGERGKDINKDASSSDAAIDSAKIHDKSNRIVEETSSVPILQTSTEIPNMAVSLENKDVEALSAISSEKIPNMAVSLENKDVEALSAISSERRMKQTYTDEEQCAQTVENLRKKFEPQPTEQIKQ
uniref:Uncharacterized protein LOC111102730 isoform X2 n=1 Tax=Crassostrea virginica TaxID=6565 RepID=A0A8B8AJF4_CRAVI|nr:uncharacterized protein LOC111102730 isoform X2 [Crassostrea virginica]